MKRKIAKWEKDYEDNYGQIPKNRKERLLWLYTSLNIRAKDILELSKRKKELVARYMNRKVFKFTFYIVPEGIARPRSGSGIFYVPNMKKFYLAMEKMMEENSELYDVMIDSESHLDCSYYRPIPNDMTKIEKILAEEKYITNIKKPDWDNLGKSTDMLNSIMIDDALVTEARVRKFYSCKPRITVKITVFPNIGNTYHTKVVNNNKKNKEKREMKASISANKPKPKIDSGVMLTKFGSFPEY